MKGYKKIWVTDDYPDDNQFWIKVFDSWNEFNGWIKYKKDKEGKWIKRKIKGRTVDYYKPTFNVEQIIGGKRVYAELLSWKEFEEIEPLVKIKEEKIKEEEEVGCIHNWVIDQRLAQGFYWECLKCKEKEFIPHS